MNTFLRKGSPMSITELRIASGINNISHEEMKERLKGDMCSCKGDGKFELMDTQPKNGKRYVKCTKCGCTSHL